jgi:alkylation response protein AidB-like acyl-CoA dehydrogenase
MEFEFSEVQQSWRLRAESLGRELPADAPAADVIMGAARVGLVDPAIDLLSVAVAVQALATESAGAAIALALHSSVVLSVAGDERFTSLARGETVAAVGLSSDDVAEERDGKLAGRASWVGPLTDRGVAVLGVRRQHSTQEGGRARSAGSGSASAVTAVALNLDDPNVTTEAVRTAALRGFVCGHVSMAGASFRDIGSPLPIMARVRVLLAAAGLGMGRRALREALVAAHAQTFRGAGGEQTVQGLLADAATELDAAMLLTWKAAAPDTLTLASASMAKLSATEATQRAVARATQVVGAESLSRGHIIERLAQDVRALELFAGRTEALREAVAEESLPRV